MEELINIGLLKKKVHFLNQIIYSVNYSEIILPVISLFVRYTENYIRKPF